MIKINSKFSKYLKEAFKFDNNHFYFIFNLGKKNTSTWSTDDVSRYLEQIGLCQYSKAFAEFCRKEISPKLYSAHLSQRRKKMIEKNLKQNEHQADSQPKVDFKGNRNKLIELIKKQKREGRKISSSSNNEPSE